MNRSPYAGEGKLAGIIDTCRMTGAQISGDCLVLCRSLRIPSWATGNWTSFNASPSRGSSRAGAGVSSRFPRRQAVRVAASAQAARHEQEHGAERGEFHGLGARPLGGASRPAWLAERLGGQAGASGVGSAGGRQRPAGSAASRRHRVLPTRKPSSQSREATDQGPSSPGTLVPHSTLIRGSKLTHDATQLEQ